MFERCAKLELLREMCFFKEFGVVGGLDGIWWSFFLGVGGDDDDDDDDDDGSLSQRSRQQCNTGVSEL